MEQHRVNEGFVELCVCSFGAQVAFGKCHFCVRRFGGVFLSPYKFARTVLCIGCLMSHVVHAMCEYYCAWYVACLEMPLGVEIGLNDVI